MYHCNAFAKLANGNSSISEDYYPTNARQQKEFLIVLQFSIKYPAINCISCNYIRKTCKLTLIQSPLAKNKSSRILQFEKLFWPLSFSDACKIVVTIFPSTQYTKYFYETSLDRAICVIFFHPPSVTNDRHRYLFFFKTHSCRNCDISAATIILSDGVCWPSPSHKRGVSLFLLKIRKTNSMAR